MATTDIIRMSVKETKRLPVIVSIISKQLRQIDGAKLLEISARQIRRLIKRVKQEGARGLVHRSRGRRSNREIARATKERVLRLCREVYTGFGPTLASEKLLERDGIRISPETLRLWLVEAKISYEQRKGRPHRRWRERKRCYGEMVQIDGSQHDWLEGRGPRIVLMGYIDDATGRAFGRFYGYEGTLPAFDSFKRYARRYGLPQSVYSDKHTTYRSTGKPTVDDELKNRRPRSQFERAMGDLGVRAIHANSPQAKGRIERLFRTFQDRLIKEMRLEKVESLDGANRFLGRYLPSYNRRFNVAAAGAGDVHRAVSEETDLEAILCIRKERVLRNDYTVMYGGRWYQIDEAIGGKKVTVEEGWGGKLRIRYQGRMLRYRSILPHKPQPIPKIRWPRSSAHPQPRNHPWRGNGPLASTTKEDISNLVESGHF
jgi:transposase